MTEQDNEGNWCEPRVSPEGLACDYIRINVAAGDPSQGTWRTAGYRPNWVWDQWQITGVFNDPLDDRYKLLREQFDFVLVDSGPVLTDADVAALKAQVLASGLTVAELVSTAWASASMISLEPERQG